MSWISEVRWGALGSDGMFWLVGFYVTLYWISPRQERFGILDKVARGITFLSPKSSRIDAPDPNNGDGQCSSAKAIQR